MRLSMTLLTLPSLADLYYWLRQNMHSLYFHHFEFTKLILRKYILRADGMALCRITVKKNLVFCTFWSVPKAFENKQVFNITIESSIALT